MRKKLTVSEVAKILDVSAHTIRYYDNIGLISLESDDDTGYRLFDIDDISKLANIIMLRDSGIPIKQIKELIQNYSKEKYKKQLQESLTQIEFQIEKMLLQKNSIRETLSLLENSKATFQKKDYDKRYLSFVNQFEYGKDRSAVDFFNNMQKNQVKDIMYKDLIYRFDEGVKVYFLEDKMTKEFLEAGTYLEYVVTAKVDEDLYKAQNEFLAYIKDNNLKTNEKLYCCFKPHALLVVDEGYKAILFTRIIN